MNIQLNDGAMYVGIIVASATAFAVATIFSGPSVASIKAQGEAAAKVACFEAKKAAAEKGIELKERCDVLK